MLPIPVYQAVVSLADIPTQKFIQHAFVQMSEPSGCSIFAGTLFLWAKMMRVNTYEFFLTGKPHFPRDRDVSGGHSGCQVHIPQFGLEISFLYYVSRIYACLSSVVAQQ